MSCAGMIGLTYNEQLTMTRSEAEEQLTQHVRAHGDAMREDGRNWVIKGS